MYSSKKSNTISTLYSILLVFSFDYSALETVKKYRNDIIFGFLLLITIETNAFAGDPIVLEFRRTFSASECNTGEVYVDGKLIAFFTSSLSLFSNNLPDNPIIGDIIVSEKFTDPAPYLEGNIPGFRVKKANKNDSYRIITLDNKSYWNYARPRAKVRSIPEDMIIIGTKVINRECYILSKAEDGYYDTNQYYSSATNIFSDSVFERQINKDNFISGKQRDAIVLLNDASEVFRITMGSISFTQSRPSKDAINLVNDDSCLIKLEHMANNVVHNGSTSYVRRDDVWFCTDGQLYGSSAPTAIEFTRDLRYIEILSNEVCAKILGLPKNRIYLININDSGAGSTTWSKCLATDDWTKISDKSDIFNTNP